MKILITGSSGHLGEALMRVMSKQSHELIGIDVTPSPYTHQVGSIANRAFVKEVMKGVQVVIHAATLHKPHVVTHTYQDFIDTNITGTLHLLEEAKIQGVQSFIFTSTTSTFGDRLRPKPGEPAVWITEDVPPIPKNIYGATKTAAEDLCQLFYRDDQLPCIVLKVSRFFPEEDDKAEIRKLYNSENIKANEFLYRRVDIQDAVDAHLLAIEKAPAIGFAKYIISATSPFSPQNLAQLQEDAPAVVANLYPDYQLLYQQKQWQMFPTIGRNNFV